MAGRVAAGGIGEACPRPVARRAAEPAERAHAASPSSRASAPGRRTKTMAARYILAMTYAMRTLTLSRPLPRFVTLRHQMELWRASPE